jgi:hypothetical protein
MEKENSIIKPSHPFSWPTRPCLLDQSEKEGQLFKPLQLFEDGSPGLRDVARVAPIIALRRVCLGCGEVKL